MDSALPQFQLLLCLMAYLFAAESLLSSSPLTLEMKGQLGPIKYIDPPNVSTPIFVVAFVACREGMGEIPADACCTDGSKRGNLATWTAVTIPPNTNTIYMEIGMNCSS